jgi:hypothetical protein
MNTPGAMEEYQSHSFLIHQIKGVILMSLAGMVWILQNNR